jgi:NAD(P)-dependent dehydrogenase (short-subunit alcohol dehydrogenase family)
MPREAKVVIVTGAAGNLGRAVVQAFADAGDTIVLVGRRRAALVDAFGEGSQRLVVAPVDLLAPTEVAAMVEMVIGRFGSIDVLCNLAGGFTMGEPVHATADATWDAMYDLNCRTMLNAVRAVVPRMVERRRGKIVNVGALSALRGSAHMGAYVASKVAVARITETMAMELRDDGINVNCVLPSIIDTPENRTAMPDADHRRWVAPVDLAAAVAFLASDAARAIHGAAIPVAGLS